MLLRKNEHGLNDHVSVVKGIAIMLMLLGHNRRTGRNALSELAGGARQLPAHGTRLDYP